MNDDGIALVRLTEVPIDAVHALLNDTRSHRHLPLAAPVSVEQTAAWVRDKDAQWGQYGYGPWAITANGRLVGWGGFQHEEGGADFALVLHHADWGLGRSLVRLMLECGFTEFGFDAVTIALPYSRNATVPLARLGWRPDGEASHGGIAFRRYRLTHADWDLRTGRRQDDVNPDAVAFGAAGRQRADDGGTSNQKSSHRSTAARV